MGHISFTPMSSFCRIKRSWSDRPRSKILMTEITQRFQLLGGRLLHQKLSQIHTEHFCFHTAFSLRLSPGRFRDPSIRKQILGVTGVAVDEEAGGGGILLLFSLPACTAFPPRALQRGLACCTWTVFLITRH